MDKKDFDTLIENYKEKENYEKIDELLEKQIIYFYSNLLKDKGITFVYRNRQRMLEEVESNLSKYHIANFRKFFEIGLEEYTDKELFYELETIYVDMYGE